MRAADHLLRGTPPCLLPLLAVLACAGATSTSPMPVASVPPPAEPHQPTGPTPPPAPPEPKRDVQVVPAACEEARTELKRLTVEAALGCSETNPCIVDTDCLVRALAADAAPIGQARMAMERACSPAGAISRYSCAVSAAPCQAGRCVAPPPAPK